ncbi:receptor-binding cancer antigen expressed on SiSo cells isoform X2 [Cryptotermes secundus]|uniref:receptor-binding cancer antigen expressed on SiSo cells isoform X2 n=1 Tax=Cryptotermes secundus TaxID=105785 RepID=UPI000CD7ACDA|nr:receptor-binding cancer antigen expressed on SiSo cells isoform X2 [Cryptotermes secundus]
MAIAFMVNRLKALFLFLLGVVKRALCCFRRRRRASGDPIPLTAVGVVPNNFNSVEGPDLQSWNSWDENPVSVITERLQNTVQQQIDLYRQQAARHMSESEEPQPDFFEDMAPRITKQTKIILKDDERETPIQSDPISPRLTLEMDPVSFTSPDLGTWEDSPGWEDQAQEDWDSDTILKEKRRLERQRRLMEQQQKRQEREQLKMAQPIALGASFRYEEIRETGHFD